MATTTSPSAWADLGELIVMRRKMMGMDQRQLAEAAGVSENTISNYERGRVPARGKMPAGYLRVEKALKFGKGSFENVLAGGDPMLEVEGPVKGSLRVKRPDEVDDPLLKGVVEKVGEALDASRLAMVFADLAARWNVSEELLERYKSAVDDLLAGMFTFGHGPPEVQKYHEANQAKPKQGPDAMELRPELGWSAYAVALDEDNEDLIGDQLRRARQEAGMSKEDLSAATKVPLRMIQLVEANDFNFPGAFMHAPLYIRLIADGLNVDAEPLVERYQDEYGEPTPTDQYDEKKPKEVLRSDTQAAGYSEAEVLAAEEEL